MRPVAWNGGGRDPSLICHGIITQNECKFHLSYVGIRAGESFKNTIYELYDLDHKYTKISLGMSSTPESTFYFTLLDHQIHFHNCRYIIQLILFS